MISFANKTGVGAVVVSIPTENLEKYVLFLFPTWQ